MCLTTIVVIIIAFVAVVVSECADNIFVSPSGEVDLACSGGKATPVAMSPLSPLAFALPNTLKSGNEFMDPRNLCTVFILEQLQVVGNLKDIARFLRDAANAFICSEK